MASRGASFSDGLQGGFRMGIAKQGLDLAKERDARYAEQFEREKQEWGDEDLLKDFEASLFEAPDGEVDATAPKDNLGTLNQAVQRGFDRLQDPKYAKIRGKALERITELGKKSQEMNDVLLQEARTRALPHMRTLYSPATTDEAKSAAVSSMMSDLYPDGRTYKAKVAGGKIALFDGDGQPVTDGKGQPQTLTIDQLDQMVTQGLATPEAFFQLRQNAIQQRAAAAAKAEDRAYTEGREDLKYRRTRRDTLSDRAASQARETAKETREEQRKRVADRRNFITKAMIEFSKTPMGTDPKAREEYHQQVRTQADELFSDGSGLPAPDADPSRELGMVEVDFDEAPTAAAKPPTQKPVVPVPKAGAPGLDTPLVAPDDITMKADPLTEFADAAGGVIGRGVRRAQQGLVDTVDPFEAGRGYVADIKRDVASKNITGFTRTKVQTLNNRSDAELISYGLDQNEVRELRKIAKAMGL